MNSSVSFKFLRASSILVWLNAFLSLPCRMVKESVNVGLDNRAEPIIRPVLDFAKVFVVELEQETPTGVYATKPTGMSDAMFERVSESDFAKYVAARERNDRILNDLRHHRDAGSSRSSKAQSTAKRSKKSTG